MKVNSTSGCQYCHHVSNDIKNINNSLLTIENELYNACEPDTKRKLELNNEIFKFINEVEDKLNAEKWRVNASKEDLQILKIKFGMAAMKSGDTDWESFNLAKEVFDNNEVFHVQHLLHYPFESSGNKV